MQEIKKGMEEVIIVKELIPKILETSFKTWLILDESTFVTERTLAGGTNTPSVVLETIKINANKAMF